MSACGQHLQVVAPYAKALIDAAYPSDAAVTADAQIQAFAAALVSPKGSNLVRISEAGDELKTKAQLAKFIEDFITIVLTHGTGHLQVGSGCFGDSLTPADPTNMFEGVLFAWNTCCRVV